MRRHLSASQKAVIAFDLLPLLEKEAKERQRRSKGRGKKVAQSCATFSGIGKVSHIAARIAKSNSTYVEILKRVNAEAPRLFPKIRSGELTVPDAKRLINGDLNNHIRLHDLDEKSILKAATEIRQHQTAERNRKQQAQERRALARLSKKPRWTITAEQKVVKCHHTGLRRSSGSQTIWNHSLVVGATDGRNAGPISSPFFGARSTYLKDASGLRSRLMVTSSNSFSSGMQITIVPRKVGSGSNRVGNQFSFTAEMVHQKPSSQRRRPGLPSFRILTATSHQFPR